MEPDLAGKITGMLLEMSEGDVIAIIEDKMACQEKVCPTPRCCPVPEKGTSSKPVCNSNLCLGSWVRMPVLVLFVKVCHFRAFASTFHHLKVPPLKCEEYSNMFNHRPFTWLMVFAQHVLSAVPDIYQSGHHNQALIVKVLSRCVAGQHTAFGASSDIV